MINNDKNIKLGVNIDHVATLRNARGEFFPDIIQASKIALNSGAAEDAAEVIAGQAALGNMTYFPLALVVLFGILFVFKNKLEESRV